MFERKLDRKEIAKFAKRIKTATMFVPVLHLSNTLQVSRSNDLAFYRLYYLFT